MQAAKNMAATVKQKAGNAAAKVGGKKEGTKFAAEEKVDKLKAQGDEGLKNEATEKRSEKEQAADDAKERGSIGDKPTPADLDKAMGASNPTNPENPQHPSNPEMTSTTPAAGAAMSLGI